MAQRRASAQAVTPHEVQTPEDDNSLGRWCLMALQVLAMALCLCLGARMWMEQSLQLPHSMCVEASPTHPVTDFRPAE